MEKSLSQKIARYLEITNYIWLFPASFAVMIGILYSLLFIIFGDFIVVIYVILVIAIFAFGVLLQYGYYKHARGELSLENVSLLWIETIIFNVIPAGLLLWTWNSNSFSATNEAKFWFYSFMSFYSSVTVFSIIGLIDNFRRH